MEVTPWVSLGPVARAFLPQVNKYVQQYEAPLETVEDLYRLAEVLKLSGIPVEVTAEIAQFDVAEYRQWRATAGVRGAAEAGPGAVVPPVAAPLRSDARRSRRLLIDGVEQLLRAGRADFSIPELAAQAHVAVATAYRHFPTTDDALAGFHGRAIGQLIDSFGTVAPTVQVRSRFRQYCRLWVEQATDWGAAARQIRSRQGYIERLNTNDPSIHALHAVLEPVLVDLMHASLMPQTDSTYAVLLWTTIFDERVIYDLSEHHHWTAKQIVNHLTDAVAGALHIQLSETES